MPELKIRQRPKNTLSYGGVSMPYKEYVFNDDLGGGMVFAHGLTLAGRVCALAYLPPLDANMERARILATNRITVDVLEVRSFKFWTPEPEEAINGA